MTNFTIHFKKKLCQAAVFLTMLLGAQNTMAQETTSYSGTTIAKEGAWCWFADPRAMHFKSSDGTIDNTYIGYIDVHGNIKASMFEKGNYQEDVLIRSCFQPDDHDNPTFLALPDNRIMIFYTRHTDEARFYYRISKVPGDITSLGDEKIITVANNTTYPSPFILSDDPNHIYLCWRGIGWHPTIAKLSMPDSNDDVKIEYGPYQMVQSTGARPYAKYQSNGKDKIYVSYTTGHPDNEYPNWLYFNVININAEKQTDGSITTNPQLCDLNGKVLSTISKGKFNVNKTNSYKTSYPTTLIDAPTNYRDWVWQITLDKDENPVVAMVRISNDKNSHEYYYARWNGEKWNLTDLANGGGRFHSSNTEYCYSGGMSIDPDTINNIYLSIPTLNSNTNQKVYEIWKYIVDDNGKVCEKAQITHNSEKNNVRPFILPGSANKNLRLCWMNGDYYYWIVSKNYPKGYPTAIMGEFEKPMLTLPTLAPINDMYETQHITPETPYTIKVSQPSEKFTIALNWKLNQEAYGGTMLKMSNLEYGVDKNTLKPYIKIGEKTYSSQSLLGTSDAWATGASGTDGQSYMSKLNVFSTAIAYNGKQITIYRNGWIDQRFEPEEPIALSDIEVGGFDGDLYSARIYNTAMHQVAIRGWMQNDYLKSISIPSEINADIALPTTGLEGQTISWSSNREDVLTHDGFVRQQENPIKVKLTAVIGDNENGSTKHWEVTVEPRNLKENIVFENNESDLSGNTTTDFTTNKYFTAPTGIVKKMRSYTALMKVNAHSLEKQPRLFDFGSGANNSFFLRANPLSAGIKYNGAATTMVNSSKPLTTHKDYYLAVSYDAETHTTKIFLDGEEVASGTNNTIDPCQLTDIAEDTRNYIGRTQWWDSQFANDNADFQGVIKNFVIFNTDLSRKEICEWQNIKYEEKELPTSLVNGNFEASYTVLANSGVQSDRAIYLPTGWTIEYNDGNNNDLTGLKSGDLYFDRFFAPYPSPSSNSKQTYWIRQNWGTSTITLKQEVRLPEGQYNLLVDVWKSGLGGDAYITVQPEGGNPIKASSLENKEQWQLVTLPFNSDGKTSTTISLSAIHTANGSEKIIGFDNVMIENANINSIQQINKEDNSTNSAIYTLSGQLVKRPQNTSKHLPAGVYVQGHKKVIIK